MEFAFVCFLELFLPLLASVAGVDYVALKSRYAPFFGELCFPLETMDNSLVNEPKYFTFNFQSGFADDLTVIQPSSFRVVIVDNDGMVVHEVNLHLFCSSS